MRDNLVRENSRVAGEPGRVKTILSDSFSFFSDVIGGATETDKSLMCPESNSVSESDNQLEKTASDGR